MAFPLGKFLSLDNLPTGVPDTMIKATVDPSKIRFKSGSNVTDWEILESRFQGSISTPGSTIAWSEGNPIYTRWRICADRQSNLPGSPATLALESMIMTAGLTLESLSSEARSVVSSGSARTLLLWISNVSWYGPALVYDLVTSPGLYTREGEYALTPSDTVLRWHLQLVLELTRRGDYSDGEGWTKYMKAPFLVNSNTILPYNLIVPTSADPSFCKPSGRDYFIKICQDGKIYNVIDNGTITISRGPRKGFRLDLGRRRRESLDRLPCPTAPSKYSPIPHPLMRLSRLALPLGASEEAIERAVSVFSMSVTKDTQAGYATSARHYIAAEKALGRSFSLPPSPSEMVFLVSYLVSLKLEHKTIRSYLSGIRFYLLSMGVATPPKLPSLAEQLIVGLEKGNRNPMQIALKKTRRAITVHMLKIIEHAIATHSSWSTYEKSLRWSVLLVAWWGSFRQGCKQIMCLTLTLTFN